MSERASEASARHLYERTRAVLPSWLAIYYDEPIELDHGSGRYVWDADGNRYLDFFGGILTTMTEHALPAVTEAVAAQAAKIIHTSTLYLNRPMVELCEEVAALIAEPIQGVGGFTSGPDGLLGAFAEVLRARDILWISDEVQTGWGRTGEHFWGWQAHGSTPDIVTFAKGVGNGLSMGGVIAPASIMDNLPANSISTFGGSPITAAGALANLRHLREHDLQANAAKVGPILLDGLKGAASPVVGDVRGKGLMIGVELVEPGSGTPGRPAPAIATAVLQGCKERGLLVGKGGLHGNVLRIAPPLSLTTEEAHEGLAILLDTLGDVS